MLTIPKQIRGPVVMRSRLMLEVASELVAAEEWPDKQVTIHMRPQGHETWRLNFFASDAPNAVDAVASGQADIAICNPGNVLAMAVRGTGPFKEPVPLRAIMVIPQFDQLGFGVTKETGINSIAEIKEKRYPLKLSLRGQRDHSVHTIAEQVLKVHGISFEDIESWDGEVRYDPEFPDGPNRMGAAERGEINAIIDEAMSRSSASSRRWGCVAWRSPARSSQGCRRTSGQWTSAAGQSSAARTSTIASSSSSARHSRTARTGFRGTARGRCGWT